MNYELRLLLLEIAAKINSDGISELCSCFSFFFCFIFISYFPLHLISVRVMLRR